MTARQGETWMQPTTEARRRAVQTPRESSFAPSSSWEVLEATREIEVRRSGSLASFATLYWALIATPAPPMAAGVQFKTRARAHQCELIFGRGGGGGWKEKGERGRR